MKKSQWIYGILAILSYLCLFATFFITDINLMVQITFWVATVGYGWLFGLSVGANL